MLCTLVLLIPVLAFLVAGSPIEKGSPIKKDARACQSIKPSFIGVVSNIQPDSEFDIEDYTLHHTTTSGAVQVDTGGLDATAAIKYEDINIDTIVEFSDIPTDAYGCQLDLVLEKGLKDVVLENNAGTPFRVGVWSVDKALSNVTGLTWNNAPKPDLLVGTFSSDQLPAEKKEEVEHRVTINSFNCKPELTFRVNVPKDINNGALVVFQKEKPLNGWVLNYNC